MKQKAIIALAGILLVILGAAMAYGFLSLLHNGIGAVSSILNTM